MKKNIPISNTYKDAISASGHLMELDQDEIIKVKFENSEEHEMPVGEALLFLGKNESNENKVTISFNQ